jgi:hypothetical protein
MNVIISCIYNIKKSDMLTVLSYGLIGGLIGSYWDVYNEDIIYDLPSTVGIILGVFIGIIV